MDNFYCNQKFWWLTVDLDKLQIYSCCSAAPSKINLSWLKDHPGQMFNTPELQQDRQMMLANQPVSSCNATCWVPESKGLSSRRLAMDGTKKTHTNIITDPEVLNIRIGTDCNMTCVYCCKFYSSAWARDVDKKSYPVELSNDQFSIRPIDKILQSLSQKDISKSSGRQFAIKELSKLYQSDKLKAIAIAGGEPFLHIDLAKLVDSIGDKVPISIYSGLGIDEKRFARELKLLPKNVRLIVSAEAINQQYEFIRYGNSWQRFINNLEQIIQSGIQYQFNATVTNLTVIGLKNFITWAKDIAIEFNLCTDPDYLSINVLDDETKDLVRQDIDCLPDFVARSLDIQPSPKQIDNFRKYIQEFSSRRNLTLDIFPTSLQKWIVQ